MPTSELSQDQIGEFVIAAHGNLPRVQELHLQHPDLLNARYARFDETALEAAGHMGARAIAEYLLAAGAPLTIFAAAMLGQADRVREFLDHDPGLASVAGVHGISLLFHAALSGKIEVAELVLAHGGGKDIDTALHAAIAFGHVGMVEWLLAHGVQNVDVLNFEGKTPLAVAVERGQDDIAALLRQHGSRE